MKFKPLIFTLWVLALNLIPYLGWSFVVLSFIEPLVTFSSNEGRLAYLIYSVCGTAMGLPAWLPHVKKETDYKEIWNVIFDLRMQNRSDSADRLAKAISE